MWSRVLTVSAVCVLAAVQFVSTSHLPADESPVEAPVPNVAASRPSEIQRWAHALSSDDFKTRREASLRLVQSGVAAIEPVLAAGEKGDLETAARCVDILKQLASSDDEPTARAAREGLKRLSKTGRPALAQRAVEALERFQPQPDPTPTRARFRLPALAMPAIRIQRPQAVRETEFADAGRKVRIREVHGESLEITVTETVDGKPQARTLKFRDFNELRDKNADLYKLYARHMLGPNAPLFKIENNGAGGPIVRGNVRIHSVSTQRNGVTGERTTHVNDNGSRYVIRDTNGVQIRLQIVETVNGQEQIRDVEADDLDDLKKKSPEAAEIYEKYSPQLVGRAARGGRIGNAPPPLPATDRRADARAAFEKLNEELESRIVRLEEMEAELKRGNRNADDVKQTIDRLRSLQQKLRETQARVDEARKRLDE